MSLSLINFSKEKKMSKFSLLVTVILAIIAIIHCQKYQCDKEANSVDLLMTDYFLMAAPSRKFPTNQNEMNSFCKKNPNIESKMKRHINNCLNNVTKRLGSLLLYSIKKTNTNTCRSRRRSAAFIDLGKCGNAANKANRKCWQKWLTTLNSIGLVEEHKTKFPLSCCATYQMKSCFTQTYENNPKQCGQKSIEGMENLFGSYVTDIMGVVCGDYNEDNDKCDQMLNKIPELKTKLTKFSPIEALTSIFNSFPEDEV